MSIGGCAPKDKIVGYGAIWQVCNPLTGDWETVAGTNDISYVAPTVNAIEVTDNDSQGYTEYIPDGIAENQTQDIEADWLLSQWSKIHRYHEDRTITDWRIVVTQITTEPYIEFCAFITDITDDYPQRDKATMSITIQPTGRPTRGELNPA